MAGSSTITPEARVGGVPIQQSAQGQPVPLLWGKNRLGVNLMWYGDFESVEKRQSQGGKGGVDTVTYDYYAAIAAAVAQGPLQLLNVWRAKQQYTAAEAADKLGLLFFAGQPAQSVWTHLQTNHAGDEAIGYSATAYLASPRYALDQGAQIPNHTVEVVNTATGATPLPMAIVRDLLSRCGIPQGVVSASAQVDHYATGMGIYACPVISSPTPAADLIEQLALINNVGLVPSEGKLKFVPYGTEAVGSYVPNTTPVYDLDDDAFSASAAPISMQRKSEADTYNHIQCEYADAEREYNTSLAEAKDDESIARSGLRTKDKITLLGVTSADVARVIAQQVLQREIAVRNTYSFTLTPRYVLLEPMDFVTLTDPLLGLDKLVVRVTAVSEESNGDIKVEAEDAPLSAFSPARYAYQPNTGFIGNYNVEPGNVTAPAFFEPPVGLTTTGLEVWCAVSGASNNWGGCYVWASLDGNTYKQVGEVRGGSRYGTTTTALPANAGGTLGVQLAGKGGQIYAGTPQDSSTLSTLCWVGNASGGEWLAYEGAALTGQGAYSLSGLVRGAYGSHTAAQDAGASFVRVDKAIGKSDPIDPDMVGHTIYFKFTSYNVYGARQQGLADVQAYPYTITGSMLLLPPAAPAGLTLKVESNGVRISWDACPELDYASTVVKLGSSWGSGEQVSNKSATSHLLGWQKSGLLTAWVAHVDKWGNTSPPVSTSLAITAPAAVTGLALTAGNTGLLASWSMPALPTTAQPVDRVELSWSSNFASIIDAKKATSATFDWRAPGLAELFVRVVDVAGNVGAVASASLIVRSPSDPSGLAVAIGLAGARATWSAPAVAYDQQPLAGVQLSWQADFSQLIETRAATSVDLGWLSAGTRTLYARYVDVAGNSGSAASVAFTVEAPAAPASLAIGFGTASIEASWTPPAVGATQQALDRVELSWGSAFTSIIDAKKATSATFGWMTAGTYTLYARYVDMAGNVGAVSQATLQVQAPAQPTMTAVETQVNLVTLRWQDAKTSQPIRKYAIWYGEAGTPLASAMLYGSAGADSRSDILQYRSSGNKVAYLVAEDVAGNVGTARQIDLSIKMPDNFVLATEYYQDWQTDELTNGTIVGGPTGQIILPAYDGRTWGQRLSSSGWTTAQQKIDAGYPVLIQPVPSSGKHVERHDCGKVIATSVVRVAPTITSASVAGYTPTIRIRASVGSSTTNWQPWLVGSAATFSDFQHIEVEYSVTSDGKGFVVLDDIYVKVEITEVTESATLVLNPADASGTVYTCTKPFLDVRAVQVTVQGASSIAKPPYYVIDDSTLPAKVYVFAHDASNNRTGGTVSLFITGV